MSVAAPSSHGAIRVAVARSTVYFFGFAQPRSCTAGALLWSLPWRNPFRTGKAVGDRGPSALDGVLVEVDRESGGDLQ